MSLSFFDAWNEAETHSRQLFNWLIPGSENYKSLITPYPSFDELALGVLAPFYSPFIFAAATIFATLLILLPSIAAIGFYILMKVSDLFNNDEISSCCDELLQESLDFAKLDACISLMFVALTLISFPYSLISGLTRTAITLNHHFYPPIAENNDKLKLI